jgi:hypothetical protein
MLGAIERELTPVGGTQTWAKPCKIIEKNIIQVNMEGMSGN